MRFLLFNQWDVHYKSSATIPWIEFHYNKISDSQLEWMHRRCERCIGKKLSKQILTDKSSTYNSVVNHLPSSHSSTPYGYRASHMLTDFPILKSGPEWKNTYITTTNTLFTLVKVDKHTRGWKIDDDNRWTLIAYDAYEASADICKKMKMKMWKGISSHHHRIIHILTSFFFSSPFYGYHKY